MTETEMACQRFNDAVSAECRAHAAEEHVFCPTCGDHMCLFWSDQSGDPEAICSHGHKLFPEGKMTLTHARYVSREEMAEVLKRLSRLAPSNEGLGGHAPLEAFIEVAKQAREILTRYTA